MKAPPALFDCFGLRRNNNKSSRKTRKMPCTNCMAEYTRRRKEIGCAKCGFGFCERCVGQKYAVPAVSSAKAVPVCNACYCLLTDPKQQQKGQQGRQWAEKTRDLPPIGQPLQQNAWGSDQMPPPSLRSLYNGTQMGRNGGASGGGGQRKADDWGELEARLARLNDPNQFEEPNGSQPVVKGQQQNVGTAKAMPSNTARLPVAPPIEELEERLAALRGVPVELVRKPRLMVMNDSDEEQDTDDGPPLSDEAAQLLRQIELGYAANPSSNRSSKGVAGGGDGGKDQTVAYDQRSLDSECPSSVLQNAISDALRAPSPSNLSSSGTASSGQLYPNLAECVRQTREDAQAAEREAMEFIRRHQQPN